ncbi:hypothetical protein AB0J80_26030 [Actinoplanes sp. NPDC049548]|uniref:hypothetical protein n=1 Tax=Actinoplanes sp. NPDC049548 TaxID=3155152 RepID=UPI003433D2CF
MQYEQAYAHLVEHNAFGWKCTNSFDRPVNMGWACRDQYKTASAYASYSNFNDPYSWSCYR